MSTKSRIDYSEYTLKRFKEREFQRYSNRVYENQKFAPNKKSHFSSGSENSFNSYPNERQGNYENEKIIDINPSDLKETKKEDFFYADENSKKNYQNSSNGAINENKNANSKKNRREASNEQPAINENDGINSIKNGYNDEKKSDGNSPKSNNKATNEQPAINENADANSIKNRQKTSNEQTAINENDDINSQKKTTPINENDNANSQKIGGQIIAALQKKLAADRKKSAFSKRKKITAAVCVLVITLSTVFLADFYLGGGAIAAGVIGRGNYAVTYYAVCLGEFDDEGDAKNQAAVIMAGGAAGYVVHDKNYKLIAAVYMNRADAEKILERNKNAAKNAGVYEIKIKKVNLNKYSQEEKNQLNAVLGYGGAIYDELYAVSNALDENKTDIGAAQTKIAALRREIDGLAPILGYSDKPAFQKIRNDLAAASAALGYLTTLPAPSPSLQANVRYTYVMILNMYRALLNEI
jgi:hypothetical protein